MKLYKLSQGSTFENIKHFIYLTNEYGVPSDEFIDAFIEQFGKDILIGKFTIEKYHCKILDELWNDIVKDCTNNNIEYKENYSSLFYIVLNTKAIDKIKEDWKQSEWNQLNEQDKLELLKQFILDFDKYIQEGINTTDMEVKDNTNEEQSIKEVQTNYTLYKLIDGTPYNPLYIRGNHIADVISDTEIRTADGEIMNIGEYIYRNNITSLNSIKMGVRIFRKIYEKIQ